jgi:hypothetical protein
VPVLPSRAGSIVLGTCACVFWACALRAADKASPREVFEKRILPIFRSPNPSSCTQCHLGGVDLKDYILPSHEKTFRSLRDQGLIDLTDPKGSKILKLISMREARTEGAALIHEKTRRAELEAFTAWIEACAADPNAPVPHVPWRWCGMGGRIGCWGRSSGTCGPTASAV